MTRVFLRQRFQKTDLSCKAPSSTLKQGPEIAASFVGSPSRLETVVYLAIVALATLAAARLIVQNFDGSLLGPTGDGNLFSYQAYFFGHNLSLLPVPQLSFYSDQTFYPYGVDHVFQPWGLEREYIGAGCRYLFGNGPWMQLYFLYSLVVTAIGAYCLLRRDFPGWRAMAVGLAVSFANFYALAKYPGHLNIACPHWAVLSVIADYLIFSRVVFRRAISARLLLARALLLMLSFGLDLGYICGLGLTSLVVTATITGIVLAVRACRAANRGGGQWGRVVGDVFATASRHPRQCVMLGTACAAVAFLYIPLVLQIVSHAKQFESLGDQVVWYASPLRLVLPSLPGNFNAVKLHSHPTFSDSPEGLFASSPGWMFIIPGAVGLVFARRRLLVFVPLLVLLASIIVYHPHDFPLLRFLPWFSFARVQGRLTIIYPVIFAIFCLGVPDAFFRRRVGQLLACCALALTITEVGWAYHGPILNRYEDPFAQDGSFDRFMQTVHDSDGEAVLEWPFCVSAGNGLGSPMNSYCDALYTTFTLRQFHEKKTVGQFFSRLHPSQIQTFYERGWPRLFSPDSPNILVAKHQTRDMTPQESRFMDEFFVLNDFCGIILYSDLLPPETLARFHEHFGQPVASTSFGHAGRMEFIPKPKHLRSLVNRELGAQVALAPAELADGQRMDTASSAADPYLVNGWASQPKPGRSTKRFGP